MRRGAEQGKLGLAPASGAIPVVIAKCRLSRFSVIEPVQSVGVASDNTFRNYVTDQYVWRTLVSLDHSHDVAETMHFGGDSIEDLVWGCGSIVGSRYSFRTSMRSFARSSVWLVALGSGIHLSAGCGEVSNSRANVSHGDGGVPVDAAPIGTQCTVTPTRLVDGRTFLPPSDAGDVGVQMPAIGVNRTDLYYLLNFDRSGNRHDGALMRVPLRGGAPTRIVAFPGEGAQSLQGLAVTPEFTIFSEPPGPSGQRGSIVADSGRRGISERARGNDGACDGGRCGCGKCVLRGFGGNKGRPAVGGRRSHGGYAEAILAVRGPEEHSFSLLTSPAPMGGCRRLSDSSRQSPSTGAR